MLRYLLVLMRGGVSLLAVDDTNTVSQVLTDASASVIGLLRHGHHLSETRRSMGQQCHAVERREKLATIAKLRGRDP